MSSTSLRVLIVGLNYSPEQTGIAPYTTGLAEGLAGRGHTVRVITGFPHYPQWRVLRGYSGLRLDEVIRGVSITRVRHTVPRRPGNVRRALMEISFGVRAGTQRWGQPTVIIAVSPALISSWLVRAMSRIHRGRAAVGIWVQDLYSTGITETQRVHHRVADFATRFESHAFRASDGVVVIHNRFGDRVVSDLGVPRHAVKVIRNWTHVPDRQSSDQMTVRARLGWRNDETIALHAGNMGAKQGLENVIEAARVAKTSGESIKFVLLGDGNQRMYLEELNSIESNVSFVDPLPDSEFFDALCAADVLLVNEKPGVSEMSVPSKLTSYFSTGLPVVAAVEEGSITAEEILASQAGLVVDPGSPRALVQAVSLLARDKNFAADLGNAGRRYCEGTLSVETALNDFDNWIQTLVESHRK